MGRDPNWVNLHIAWGRQAICLGSSVNLPVVVWQYARGRLTYINWICAIFVFHLSCFEVFRAD